MAYAAAEPLRLADVQAGRASTRGGPPTKADCRRLIDGSRDEWSGPMALMRRQDDVFFSTHTISLPEDIEKSGPTYVYSFKAAQQVLGGEGLLGNRKAEIKLAPTNTRSDAARSRVELMQNHMNRGFDRLEQQADDPVFSKVVQDVLKFGRGVDCLEPDPRRIGSYSKTPADFDEPKAYRKDRQKFLDRLGERGGRLPMNLRHVPPMNFMYRESPERGGIAVAIERRDRYVADVMDDPRYRDSEALDWLWREYYRSGTLDDRLAGTQKVSVWTVQDGRWTTQFVTPPLRALESQSPYWRPDSAPVDAFSISQDIGEIAFQQRNPLGRPWYTVTKGLRTSSSNSALSLVGMYYYAMGLIVNLDWLLTIQSNALKEQAFAPWVYLRAAPTINGQQGPLLYDPQRRRVKIAHGNGFITELDPGTIQQLIAEAPPELLPMVEAIRREINLLLIPETLYDAANSSSGYEYNSIRNTVLGKMRPIIEGFELAMARRADLYADVLLWMGEEISVSTVRGNNLVETYTFDPKEYRELEITSDTTFRLPRPEDSMADLQAADFAIEKRLLDVATSRERYLSVTNHDEIERAIALDDYKRSPQVAEFVISKAATEAGLALDQQAAESQGDVSQEQLLNTNPALLAQAAQQAQPGTPGYAQILAAAQKAGLVPPTAASPQAAPPEQQLAPPAPAAPPVPIGPPAGQAPASPGGPRLTGGAPQ